ncbi:hypothetical protein C8Q70DRAFT_456519 [Cubamyces menziesii]|nr:hypothetical protein C8Q70DRAFT_456519 [Cubamyces menziesii]
MPCSSSAVAVVERLAQQHPHAAVERALLLLLLLPVRLARTLPQLEADCPMLTFSSISSPIAHRAPIMAPVPLKRFRLERSD